MKGKGYQRRFYRDWPGSRGLVSLCVAEQETDLKILSDKPVDKDRVSSRIRALRRDIENYIRRDSRFLASLKPVSIELGAAAIVRRMAEASKKAGVGPMAAVAGAIADFLGRELCKIGYKEIIIENGGDLFLKINRQRLIGFYAGSRSRFNKLGILLKPQQTPLGICTSSATLGHSLSFGRADSATILAKDAGLADAVATAACNRVRSLKDMPAALEFARRIPGVSAAVLIMRNRLLCWGDVELKEL